MGRFLPFFLALLFGCGAMDRAFAQARPQFRPAVFLTGERSLVNQIDAAGLMKQGQKDGAVMFASVVSKEGRLVQSRVYRGMPGTDALRAEVAKRLEEAQVAPAIYNYQPVEVLLYGTVVFAVVNEKPRLRIFLHQDPMELQKESDFIGPQPVFGGDSNFSGLHYPQMEHPVAVTGVVDLGLKVDANGNLTALRVIAQEPALLNIENLPSLDFGKAAVEDFQGARFIPPFRDGDPDAAETVIAVCYEAEPFGGAPSSAGE